ncbi:MAG: UbiA family prenyltransferase [Planctomycetota bacterium]
MSDAARTKDDPLEGLEIVPPELPNAPVEPGWVILLRQARSIWRLTRVGTAFAAIGNAWFAVLWSRSAYPGERAGAEMLDKPLALLLLYAGLSAIGLVAYGAVLNDLFDLKRDRTTRPDRPLASGEVSVEQAVVLVAVTLLISILGAALLGTLPVLITLGLAAALLVLSAAAKFVPAIGPVLLGVVFAGQMLVPNPQLVFLWPVWMVMTQALFSALLFHGLGRRVPKISSRAVWSAVLGWGVLSAGLYALGNSRVGPDSSLAGFWVNWVPLTAAIGPALLVFAFLLVLWRKVAGAKSRPRAAEKAWRYGSQWLILYHVAWCAGAGWYGAAAVLALLGVVAILGTSVLRELYGAIDTPLLYRR